MSIALVLSTVWFIVKTVEKKGHSQGLGLLFSIMEAGNPNVMSLSSFD